MLKRHNNTRLILEFTPLLLNIPLLLLKDAGFAKVPFSYAEVNVEFTEVH
ncbi:hypothetical protein GH754_05370 [Salinibacillus xinjiangensis]|uniref:Uncharacterized protein n=1 Tax=Salinibacillus xinjiangensis TaxID=1229268 RepID=A0A6G1X476_9BACI|nr:hypothetical protein [Salinibacillus xinjiangensis]